MKIGDRVFVRGYIDEIRKDTVIIRNAGGYFGTIPSEVTPSAQPEVIRCKDCKWSAQDEDGWWYCVEIGGHMGDGEKGDGFCSDAERRTE